MKSILSLLLMIGGLSVSFSQGIDEKLFVCTPCGYKCDSVDYKGPGACATCGMAYVEKSTVHFDNITFAEMCDRVQKNKNVLLLDVRTPQEFTGENPSVSSWGNLKNTVNINVSELPSRLAELEPYHNKEIIVYCSHSHRSPRATYMMINAGFKNVTNVIGGVSILKQEFGDNACLSELFVEHQN